jgi:hypothetical protein
VGKPPKVDAVPLDARPFRADLDACELDERHKPLNTWPVRSLLLSRAKIVLLSRRMTFVGRRVLMAVHQIDAMPIPLCGKVSDCEYHGEGQYRLVLDLEAVPKDLKVSQWLEERKAPRAA